MEFEKIDTNDPMDQLLREYLLEKNPKGLKGESLMEEAALGELGRGPAFAPDAEAEAEVIYRLNAAIAGRPVKRKFPWWIPVGTAAAAAIALILVFSLSSNQTEQIAHNDKGANPAVNPNSVPSNTTVSPLTTNNTTNANENKNVNSVVKQDNNPGPFIRDFNASVHDNNLPLTYSPNPSFSAADPLLASEFIRRFGPSDKNYSFDADEGLIFETPSGALLSAPPSAFLTLSGAPAKGIIEFHITESQSLGELIRAGINLGQGMQDYSIGSAIQIEAFQLGKPLILAEGKEIYVEVPGIDHLNAYQVVGIENLPKGKPVLAGRPDNSIVPVALDKLKLEEFWCTDHRDVEWNKYINMIADPANEKSYISSVQFRERMQVAWDLGHVGQILKVYLDNKGNNLWQSDKMVADRIASGEIKVLGNVSQAEKKFRVFSLQGYEKAILGIPSNIDLDKPGTMTTLTSKGVNASVAEKIIRFNRIRTRSTKALENSYATQSNGGWKAPAHFGAFNLNRLGWLAFVKPMNHREKQDLVVNFSGVEKHEIVSIVCVQSDYRSIHSGIVSDKSGSLEIPSGQTNSWIVGIAYRNGTPFLALQKIYSGIPSEISIVFRPTDYSNLKAELTSVDN